MLKKLLFLVVAASLCLASSANAATIIWVSFHSADDAPSAAAAGVGFTEAPDKGYTDLLRANGFDVTRYVTTATPDATILNAADLVIVSRSAPSGNYQDAGATAWNGISAPTMILGGYVLRNSRMGYTTGGTMVDTTGDITLTVADPTHPIFTGISLTNGTMTNPYAGVVVLPTDGTTLSRGISINNNPVDDEGMVLATVSAAGNGPAGGMVIAEWQAGATLVHSGGAGTDVLAGHRLVFLTGSREPSGVTGGDAAGLYDLHPDGAQMFLNAVRYMLGVRPTKASGPVPANGEVVVNTWVSLGWTPGDFAVTHDIYLGESLDDVSAGTADTFRGNQASTLLFIGLGLPGDPYPAGLVPGTTYYWRIDEVNTADPNSPWKGDVWSFSIAPRTAYNPNPGDGAQSVALSASLSWTGGFESKLHTVYLGEDFDTVNNATSGGTIVGATTFNPGPLKAAKVYYWRVDETNPPNTYKGQVWSFTTVEAVNSPSPANGAGNAAMNAVLTWTPGDDAASHQVYFGTDKEAVRKATAASPEYKGTKALGAESYDPGLLAWDSAYYWRIDEVNATNPNSPWKGPVWSFTTGGSLIVDDIESYNDLPETDPGSNRVYTKWIDGYGTTTNGAFVGNLDVPLTLRTNVHGGAQAMPLSYDNNLKYSEATLMLTGAARDWTRQGVANLSLWFRGVTTNAPERMYVALNGTAVVYNDDTSLTKKTSWTPWVIPLQQFTALGVNLSNVTSITIGFGTRGSTATAGGTGQMYFDDIRLYQSITP